MAEELSGGGEAGAPLYPGVRAGRRVRWGGEGQGALRRWQGLSWE